MNQPKHKSQVKTYLDYLRKSTVPKQIIDVFLDPDQPSWAKFDPELGYVLANSLPRDGIDGSATPSPLFEKTGRESIPSTPTTLAALIPTATVSPNVIRSVMGKRGSPIYLPIWANRSKTSAWAAMALTKPTEEWCVPKRRKIALSM